MPLSQVRIVAAVAIASGLSAAGAVLAEDKLGLAALQQDLRARRRR